MFFSQTFHKPKFKNSTFAPQNNLKHMRNKRQIRAKIIKARNQIKFVDNLNAILYEQQNSHFDEFNFFASQTSQIAREQIARKQNKFVHQITQIACGALISPIFCNTKKSGKQNPSQGDLHHFYTLPACFRRNVSLQKTCFFLKRFTNQHSNS
jgi:hypothetical protein